MATRSSILAWKIPWGLKESDRTEHTYAHTHTHTHTRTHAHTHRQTHISITNDLQFLEHLNNNVLKFFKVSSLNSLCFLQASPIHGPEGAM